MLKFYIPEITAVEEVLDQAGQASKEEFDKLENMIRTREMKNKHDDNDKNSLDSSFDRK